MIDKILFKAWTEFNKKPMLFTIFILLCTNLFSTYKWIDSYKTSAVIKEVYERKLSIKDSLFTEEKVARAKLMAIEEFRAALTKTDTTNN